MPSTNHLPKYWVVKVKGHSDVMISTASKSLDGAIEKYANQYAKEYRIDAGSHLYYNDPTLEVVLVELNTLQTVEN